MTLLYPASGSHLFRSLQNLCKPNIIYLCVIVTYIVAAHSLHGPGPQSLSAAQTENQTGNTFSATAVSILNGSTSHVFKIVSEK